MTSVQHMALVVVLDTVSNRPQWPNEEPESCAFWCAVAGLPIERALELTSAEASDMLTQLERL